MTRKIVLVILGVSILGFAGMPLVPYSRNHTNPPITAEPAWPDAASPALAARACFDCHLNESVWPNYSGIAPISWIAQNHVNEARPALNISEWDRPQPGNENAAEVPGEGEMPPGDHRFVHRAATRTTA